MLVTRKTNICEWVKMPLLLQCFSSGLRCHSFDLLTCCNLLNYESSYGFLAIRAGRLRACTFYHATYTLLIWPFSLTFGLTFLSHQGRLPTRAVFRVIAFAWSHNCTKAKSSPYKQQIHNLFPFQNLPYI